MLLYDLHKYKATKQLLPIDFAQIITYLYVTRLKLGILVNFGANPLQSKRFANTQSHNTAKVHSPTNVPDSNDLLYPELSR